MQRGSGVSETPASGAGPEQRPCPFLGFRPRSCSERLPAHEHRTESPGPHDALRCALSGFLGLRSTQIPTNDLLCAWPCAGTTNTDRAPVAPILGSSQAPAPAEAAPRHRGVHGPQAPSTSHHRGLSGGVPVERSRTPDTACACCSTCSPPTLPDLTAHWAISALTAALGPLHRVCCLVKKSLTQPTLRKHSGSGAGPELSNDLRCCPASQQPWAGLSASRSLHFLMCQTDALRFASRLFQGLDE